MGIFEKVVFVSDFGASPIANKTGVVRNLETPLSYHSLFFLSQPTPYSSSVLKPYQNVLLPVLFFRDSL